MLAGGDGQGRRLRTYGAGVRQVRGGELNYSSDLDLVFVACTQKHVTAATELARELTSALGAFSDEGFLFERMALVKLRPITGDESLAMKVLQARDAFVYSGAPIDYDNLRHLRQRQANELVPRGLVSAKHSAGGLVEVEYFVQAKQIEVGAADESVRVTNTLEAIDQLQRVDALNPKAADELRAAYAFLRRLINALRVVRGHAKDLTIPPAETREFAYLARRLGAESPAQLQADLARHLSVGKKPMATRDRA